MGSRWKSDLAASPDFVKIAEQDEISNYIKPSVVHTVGEVKIISVMAMTLDRRTCIEAVKCSLFEMRFSKMVETPNASRINMDRIII